LVSVDHQPATILENVISAGTVVSVSLSGFHVVSKAPVDAITLQVGHGVVGDCHGGETVQHLSRIRRDPTQPNLRQVHLIQAELFAEVAGEGCDVRAGELGENVTTSGIDLLALPTATTLRLGAVAAVQVTGLRNPCVQINGVHDGLLGLVVGRDDSGEIVRRAGVLSVVLRSGVIRPGDRVAVELPDPPYEPLRPV
jgi:MOSC domain-containing protein YiiM